MTGEVQRILADAREVFIRLDADATRHLQETWRGQAGGRALEALRRYISDALDGLAGRSAFPPIATSTLPAPALGTPAGTVPAGFDAVPPTSATPMMLHRNGSGDDIPSTPTYASASPSAPHMPASALRPTLTAETPLPTGSFNPASLNAGSLNAGSLNSGASLAAQPSVPPGATAAAPPRTAIPFTPLMGAAYPGAFVRDQGGSRRTPGYLITIDNGNGFIGPLPQVSPPVIGAQLQRRA
jgi:hypothetical protein